LRIPLDGSRQRPHSSVPRLGSGHGRVLGRRRTRGPSAGELRCLGQDDAEPRGLRSQDRLWFSVHGAAFDRPRAV